MAFIDKSTELIRHDDVTCVRGVLKNRLIGKMAINFFHLDNCLIDTGTSSMAGLYLDFFRRYPISQAALTHVHEDHAGLAPWIKSSLGVPVYLHAGDHEEAARGTRLYLYRKMVWGNRAPFAADALPERIETGRHTLQVIHTPGHSPNHVVYLEKNRGWLFTGDLYIGPKQNVSFLEENTLDAIASIKKILAMDWDTIFCAHAGVQTDGKKKFMRKLRFFEDIRGNVEKLYGQGVSLMEINRRLFPKKDLWERLSHGEWTSYRMISTCLHEN